MFRSSRLKDTLEATIEWKQPKLYDSETGDEFFFIFFLLVTSYPICKQL